MAQLAHSPWPTYVSHSDLSSEVIRHQPALTALPPPPVPDADRAQGGCVFASPARTDAGHFTNPPPAGSQYRSLPARKLTMNNLTLARSVWLIGSPWLFRPPTSTRLASGDKSSVPKVYACPQPRPATAVMRSPTRRRAMAVSAWDPSSRSLIACEARSPHSGPSRSRKTSSSRSACAINGERKSNATPADRSRSLTAAMSSRRRSTTSRRRSACRARSAEPSMQSSVLCSLR